MDETTEQMTEQEVQVTEPEEVATPETGEETAVEAEAKPEASEAEAKTVQEELAEQVKACVVESKSCEGLGSQFDDAAKKLHIRVDDLIEDVFEIVTRKED